MEAQGKSREFHTDLGDVFEQHAVWQRSHGRSSRTMITPEQFIAKWKAADLKERAAAQSHFDDLCELLGEDNSTDADPKGEWYCFERGATKTTGGEGWADVW